MWYTLAMSVIVGNLIEQIRRLTDEERGELNEALRILELERRERLLDPMRAEARARGITQEDIDRACDEVREENRLKWREGR